MCRRECATVDSHSLVSSVSRALLAHGAVVRPSIQRCTRVLYRRNNARTLLAVVVYSALQAFVLLGIAEIVLPYSWTQGQGSLSMW